MNVITTRWLKCKGVTEVPVDEKLLEKVNHRLSPYTYYNSNEQAEIKTIKELEEILSHCKDGGESLQLKLIYAPKQVSSGYFLYNFYEKVEDIVTDIVYNKNYELVDLFEEDFEMGLKN